MKNYIYIISAFLFIFLQSCKKELEKVPMIITTNQLTVETDTISYTVVALDSLKINGTITATQPGHSYSYQWKAWSQLGTDVTILSTEKDLNIKVTLAPLNYYFLEYVVKDETTGVSFFAPLMRLTVQPGFYEGWLVSSNKNNNGMLSFIRNDDVLFLSPAEDINEKTYNGEAISAFSSVDFFASFSGLTAQIMYITKEGAYRFDATSFLEMKGGADLFESKKTNFSASAFQGFSGIYTDQLLIDEGEIYGAYGGSGTITFSESIPGDYYAFPYLFLLGGAANNMAVYDNKNKRFLNVASQTKSLSVMTGTGSYPVDNVGKTMIAADFGPGVEYFCVMYDETTGKYYIYSLKGSVSSNNAGINQEILNSPELNTATSFATSSLLPHMYYASGNKIYLYDINANSSSLVYTFPDGVIIKDMEMFKYPRKQIALQNDPLYNKRLVVGVDNGANGEVYYLDLTDLGAVLNNTYSQKFTGFGQIVHLNYRNQQ